MRALAHQYLKPLISHSLDCNPIRKNTTFSSFQHLVQLKYVIVNGSTYLCGFYSDLLAPHGPLFCVAVYQETPCES